MKMQVGKFKTNKSTLPQYIIETKSRTEFKEELDFCIAKEVQSYTNIYSK